ncbi:hypothetical protein H2198_005980 [Neophaeococcomyces mojaviensis]|uniref:Uncharacterized protein n=1 Tax=Neophaeococcomyces mojaviensis TaxID=3383035 RepID=A0ACC3A490_9EURO|nr:hypothetical protein H2198_005980 [Knufia sp. JES_112]
MYYDSSAVYGLAPGTLASDPARVFTCADTSVYNNANSGYAPLQCNIQGGTLNCFAYATTTQQNYTIFDVETNGLQYPLVISTTANYYPVTIDVVLV